VAPDLVTAGLAGSEKQDDCPRTIKMDLQPGAAVSIELNVGAAGLPNLL
jgi:hypothetical protein